MSNFDLFSTLENCGESLTKRLDEAKSKHKTTETPIHNEVETTITGLIDNLKLSQDGEFTTAECFGKVVKKIEWTLEEPTKYDEQNASKYGDLATTLGNFVSDLSRTLPTSTATHNINNNINNKSNNNNNNGNDVQDMNIDLENLYPKLTFQQIVLLELFSVLPQGTEIKENDLFLCWFSRAEINNVDSERTVKFEQHLNKLVEMKIIERVVTRVGSVKKNSKREGVKYTMPNKIRSNIQKYSQYDDDDKFRITDNGIVANTDASNLTTKRLNSLLSKTTRLDSNESKMFLLGSWNNDPTKYIVVEDMDALTKAFNKWPFTRFLSLQGVSGIVELPSLAPMSGFLKVLNLKGCHNLESLPPQFNIVRNWELGYLDISECYLLDHPPDAFDGCSKLRVLKGFVLPKEQPPHQPFISNPLQFQHLWKLALRTKRFNFPTNFDLATLCELESLTHLKITWVGACSDTDNEEVQFDDNSKFPPKLTKFEMEAASDNASTKILDLIARQKESTPIPLEKLYIKGGNLSKIDQNVDCKILRLQYLPNMQHSCYDMMRTFPKLHRLEMSKDVMYSMLRQSFQKATGTTDENSGWERSFTRQATPSSTS